MAALCGGAAERLGSGNPREIESLMNLQSTRSFVWSFAACIAIAPSDADPVGGLAGPAIALDRAVQQDCADNPDITWRVAR